MIRSGREGGADVEADLQVRLVRLVRLVRADDRVAAGGRHGPAAPKPRRTPGPYPLDHSAAAFADGVSSRRTMPAAYQTAPGACVDVVST